MCDTLYDISVMYTKRHLNPGSTVIWVKRNHKGMHGWMMKQKRKRGRERDIKRNLSICIGKEKSWNYRSMFPSYSFSQLIISRRFIDKLNRRRKDDGLLNLRSEKKKKKKMERNMII